MHLSYMPLWQKKLNIHGPFVLPCWMTNPLHALLSEHRVLFIHTPQDLPEDIGAAIINEIAVFNKVKTLMYSQCEGGVAVIKRLMEQLHKVEDLASIDIRLSKDFNRFADSVKAIEKAPLYINDKPLSTEELLDDINCVMTDTANEKKTYRIVIVEDLLSLKGITREGVVVRKMAQSLSESLKQIAVEHNISIVVMSRKPLRDSFPAKAIQKAFVTIEGKEHMVETILTD